jgi:hypothetical protein
MTDPRKITVITVEKELHTCPECGYERGFHVSFASTAGDRDSPVRSTRDVCRVILICPECGARYDSGWRVSCNEPENVSVTSAGTPSSCVPHGSPAACLPLPLHHDDPDTPR